MSAMSNLHAEIMGAVADAETVAGRWLWVWTDDPLCAGERIGVLCVRSRMGDRVVVTSDWGTLTDVGRYSGCLRTVVGVITRFGDSVRVRSSMGRDEEIGTVSDAMGVFV